MKNIKENWMRLFFLVFLVGSLISCNTPRIENFIDIKSLDSDTLIRLHNWAILAPLLPDTNIAPLQRINQDLLAEYGKSENNISTMDQFIAAGKSVQQRDTSIIIRQVEMPLHILDLNNFFPIDPPMTAYLATHIESSEDSEVALNISAYQSARFWLNGEEIYNINWKRGRNFYREEFVPVTLKKGRNFLWVKLSVSDKAYRSPQWKLEVDISNIKTAKNLYYSAYSNHFLRKSLVNAKDSLRLYTGIFSKDTGKYQIFQKSSDKLKLEGNTKADRKTGEVNIQLSKGELQQGLYTCKLAFENRLFSQDFFVGDIDLYIDSLKKDFDNLKGLSQKQKLDVEGIIHRLYVDSRREAGTFDDIAEHWNRLRIPSLADLETAITQLKQEQTLRDPYFLRSYYSDYWQGYYYYSAYLPRKTRSLTKMPAFILIMDSSKEVRNWEKHFKNTQSRSIKDLQNIADEQEFIAVMTDCGGNIEEVDKLKLFGEILDNLIEEYPVDPDRVYIVGNCETTRFSLAALKHYASRLSGAGLINPNNSSSPYLDAPEKSCPHKLAMVYAQHSEVIPKELSLQIYDKLKKIDSSASLYTDSYSTHYSAPDDYTYPIYLDLLFRKKH